MGHGGLVLRGTSEDDTPGEVLALGKEKAPIFLELPAF